MRRRSESKQLNRKSDPSGWAKRNLRIATLAKSGKSFQQIGAKLGCSRERVRQLAAEMGIGSPKKIAITEMHRNLTRSELNGIKRSYESGESMKAIGEKFHIGAARAERIVRDGGFKRKYRCRVCGREFERLRNGNGFFYCRDCAAERKKEQVSSYLRHRYKTDPEFKKRTLYANAAWRRSEAGERWLAEYRRKQSSEKSESNR